MKQSPSARDKFIGTLVVAVLIVVLINVWPSHHSAGSSAADRPTPTPVLEDQAGTDAAVAFFRDNYTGTGWYGSIVQVHVYGARLDVETNIYPDSEGKAVGQHICGASKAYLLTGGSGVSQYRVLDQNGGLLCVSS